MCVDPSAQVANGFCRILYFWGGGFGSQGDSYVWRATILVGHCCREMAACHALLLQDNYLRDPMGTIGLRQCRAFIGVDGIYR